MAGPGMFKSNGKKWVPAMHELRGPSPDRQGVIPGDVMLYEDDGKTPKLVPDPAALESIRKALGNDSASFETVNPDGNETKVIQPTAQASGENSRVDALENKLNEVMGLLAKLSANGPVVTPKKRGRPPKGDRGSEPVV